MVAFPAGKRYLTLVLILTWLGAQIMFFLPARKKDFVVIPSRVGNFLIFQNQRQVVLVGAYSDRRQRGVRKELIPFLKKQGVRQIQALILTGYHAHEMGALSELLKNFPIKILIYPESSAVNMRRLFQVARSVAEYKRLESHFRFGPGFNYLSIENLLQNQAGVLLKVCSAQHCMLYLSSWSVAVPPLDSLRNYLSMPIIFPPLEPGRGSPEVLNWLHLFKVGS